MSSPVLGDKDHQGQSRILNLPAPIADTEPARRVDLPVIPIGSMMYWLDYTTVPDNWLAMNGAVIPVSEYSELVTALYCGDENNGATHFHYRGTSEVDIHNNRSTTGDYFKLGDFRGRYIRGAGTSGGNWENQDPTLIPYFYFNGAAFVGQNSYSPILNEESRSGSVSQYRHFSSMILGNTSNYPVWSAVRPRNVPAIPIVYAGPYAA